MLPAPAPAPPLCYSLMLHAALSPDFLLRVEGRRFLACLFNLHPQLVRELTCVIKNQVRGPAALVGHQDQVGWRLQTCVVT